jgi:hypothetical protein
MARQSRRPTFWAGTGFDDSVLVEDTQTTLELLDPADIESSKEPTLTRIVGHIQIGSTPESATVVTISHLKWALVLMNVSSSFPSLNSEAGWSDERIIYSGFLRSVYILEPFGMISVDGDTTVAATANINQRGPWEFERFDARAMRRAREGDSLCLAYYLNTVEGNPVSVKLAGFVRALIKER